MLKSFIFEGIESDHLNFIEMNIINPSQGMFLDTALNKKKYYRFQNVIKALTHNKQKKFISSVKMYNNYEEVQSGQKIYYYDKNIKKMSPGVYNKLHYIIKNYDNKILDPIEFPDLKIYHNEYNETSYRYRYMPDNRVVNSIDIYFSNIQKDNKTNLNIFLKFKVSNKNKNHILKNVTTIFNKLSHII
jgi:hypothetical protein